MDNFDDMNLREELLRGIYAYGFEKPSAIQQRAIMPCIKGKMATSWSFITHYNFFYKLQYWIHSNTAAVLICISSQDMQQVTHIKNSVVFPF